MKNRSKKERIRDLTNAMRKERGDMNPEWAYLVERDVDFMETYNKLYEKALTGGRALPAKTKELITIGILAFRGLHDAVYVHAKRALELGATKQELMEAIETTIISGGAPTLRSGLRALVRLEEEEKDKTR